MEAHTGYICQGSGRIGHWFTYVDSYSTSSRISPAPNDTAPVLPELLSTARGTSQYAMHMTGTYYEYAGMGCVLNNATFGAVPKTFNATGLTGVTFYAKGSGGLRLLINTSGTVSTEFGGKCDATVYSCIGAYTTVSGLSSSTWNVFKVSFASLLSGTTAFDITDLWSINFEPTSLASFDLWVDDVSFY